MNLETEKNRLLQRDAEWAAVASQGRDIERILSYWTDDAIILPPGQPAVVGKAALRQFVEASLQIPGFGITWTSSDVSLSADGNLAYETMQGPNEFTVTGNLKDWDRTKRLGEITVPTLITCGRYDELGPACAEILHRGIPNSEMVIFEKSAHMAHLEETEGYLQVTGDFLNRVERKPRG